MRNMECLVVIETHAQKLSAHAVVFPVCSNLLKNFS